MIGDHYAWAGRILRVSSPYNINYLNKLEESGLVPKNLAEKTILGQRAFLMDDILTRCKCGVFTWPTSTPLVFEYPLLEGR